MKKLYTRSFLLICALQLTLYGTTSAQCIDGNEPTPVFIDTTIYFGTGVTATTIKFPQFDPETGMLSCVKLITTMIGIIDTVAMQNLSSSPQTATFDYVRSDEMTGPGLTPSMTNSFSKQYGPYNLTSFDNNFNQGTDHVSIPRDSVLNKTVTRTLTDSTEISQFYGKDSVQYNYVIDVSTLASISGGSSSSLVLTSAMVKFRFEYCACNKATLPVGLKNFTIAKTGTQTANLYWEGENDNFLYAYDIQMSRDGKQYTTVAVVDRKYVAAPAYHYTYTANASEHGRIYFRVRQRWQNGYVKFSPVRMVELTNTALASISLYPNPSKGSVGLKVWNVKGGKIAVQVSNANGQQVMTKELQVAETDYKLIGNFPSGMYWITITDLATKASTTRQLFVQ